ncbi:hypothetical protein ACIQXD_32850 [Streptomyces uncialis]|uniref:hypothetical protein n=1 Tax=Streptomyces uncialis TaxID=1048205 RepID=UPI00380B56F4
MPDPHDHHDLEAFAAVLTGELPGTWTSDYQQHAEQADQHARAEDVWDMNLVSDAISKAALGQDAVLTRDDGTRLYLIGRPGTEEFLAAAMAPPGLPPEAFRGVPEPDGITVPDDPFLAAKNITTGLLPRYDKALAQVRHNATHPAPPAAAPAPAWETVTMTWSGDGLLTAKPESQKAAAVLHRNGFVWEPAGKAFVLSADDTAHQARAVRTAGAQLTALGIGTVMRHPPNRPAPDTSVSPALQRAKPAVRTR